MTVFYISLISLFAYVVGSIPTGFLIARFKGIKDIRQYGSGNIGSTNVARLLGIPYFFLVFFVDGFKAFIYLWLTHVIIVDPRQVVLVASAIFLGNTHSLFLSFRGGKGVATLFGLLLVLNPKILLFVFPFWVIIFLLTRTVGIASVLALFIAPIIAVIIAAKSEVTMFVLCASLWSIYLHRDNIKKYMLIARERR